MYVLDYDQPRCETCRWWMSDGTGPGECHRYPPQLPHFRPNANGHGLDWIPAARPQVGHSEFCGEHQPEPSARAKPVI